MYFSSPDIFLISHHLFVTGEQLCFLNYMSSENELCCVFHQCGLCWEIVHPLCLSQKFENLTTEGVLNEDLPNSWKCAKCCYDGKEGQLKVRDMPETCCNELHNLLIIVQIL